MAPQRYPMAGDRLVKLMRKHGVTSEELARRLGSSPDTIAKWRQGKRQPCCRHMDLAVKLATVEGNIDAMRELWFEIAS